LTTTGAHSPLTRLNVLIGSKEHNIYAEIDVFLENGDAALAVEVKTQANIADIRDHVERMEKLRRNFFFLIRGDSVERKQLNARYDTDKAIMF
jgi:Holliday junction resolvase-like predicted endonuclease